MAARDVACRDAAEGELEGLATEQGHDPADRADEAGAVEAGPRHGARPGKVVDRARQDFAEDLLRGAAALGLLGGEVFALWRLDDEDVDQADALLFGEADGGACRLADLIVGYGLRRAGDFADDVFLL